MLFNSYEFLFLFLPVVLLAYYVLLPKAARPLLLTLSSYLFYGWWDYRFCALLIISTAVDYVAGKQVHIQEDKRSKKAWLLVSLVTNLSLLGFFKYFDLAAGTINALSFRFLGAPSDLLPLLHVVLPVGISFYTFQSMSYSLDIYYGEAKPARSFIKFACYVALFPQLIAGPIVRYRELADQLEHRTHTVTKFALGICFFVVGLAKKVILADGVAPLVTYVFDMSEPGLIASWVGVLSYTMQIYYDFSGYSDMAIGLGLMLGFEIPQNFNSPYKSISITDFWRRWHMSLSRWLRDYLYIPLGGNRKGSIRTYVNLFITMLLGGLWHGASWTFVIWGGYHGMLLATERMMGKKSLISRCPQSIQIVFTFLLVTIGWVIFRSESVGQALQIYKGLVGVHGVGTNFMAWLQGHPLHVVMLLVTLTLTWSSRNSWEVHWQLSLRTSILLSVLFIVCVMVILLNASSPFLYFQF